MCSKLSTFSQNSGEVHSSNSFELFAMLLTGLVLGTGGAVLTGEIIKGLLFGVSPRDPAIIMVAVGIFLLVTVVACVVPVWRAGTTDPLVALRYE